MSTTPKKMTIGQRYGDTHAGRKRRRNEDTFVCDPPLFAVADGMGGAQAGEVASSLAAAALRERGDRDAGGETRVVELIQEANRRVHQRALADAAASGMGTTMTVALFEDGKVSIGHVGDSRAYVLRDGELQQLTDDHSLVAELVRRGELSPEEAEIHPQRSVITRALGTDPEVDVDAFPFESRPGDIFLLCSDGLTTMVDTSTITTLVDRNRSDLRQATHALIETANNHGGEDNVTAVLFEIVAASDGEVTAAAPAVVDPAEEDTLHPGDATTVPATPDDEPHADITTVASAQEMRAAMEAVEQERQATLAPDDAAEHNRPESEAAGAQQSPELERAEPPSLFWRKVVSLLVIVGLVALIAFLVLRGLAR